MLEELHWVNLHLTMNCPHLLTSDVTLNIHLTLKLSDWELKRMMIISDTPTVGLISKLEWSLNKIMMLIVTLTMEDQHQALNLEWSLTKLLLKRMVKLMFTNIPVILIIMNKLSILKPWKNWWCFRKRRLTLCCRINPKLKLMSSTILKNLSRSKSNTKIRLIKILFNLKSRLKEFFKH